MKSLRTISMLGLVGLLTCGLYGQQRNVKQQTQGALILIQASAPGIGTIHTSAAILSVRIQDKPDAGEPGFMLLSDGSIHRRSSGEPPADQYYVNGTVVSDKKFQPAPDATVLGKGKDCPKMSENPGFRLLESGKFMPMQAGQAIVEPYVEGCRRDNTFLPKASPTIHQPPKH